MWCAGIVAAFLFCQAAAFGQSVVVSVVDAAHLPVAGARLQLRGGEAVVAAAETDEKGQATFANLAPAHYTLAVSKDGLEQLERPEIEVEGAVAADVSVLVTMAVMGRHEAIDVVESIAPIDQGATVPTRLPPQAVRELPSRPATVAEALPLVPGVVRKPDGALQISGSAEHRSALIVNSADVTDPATGQFGLTVPIDSVETLNVYQTPYMAEYGRFTAGLVSVETRRGGDKWKWELNDPFPDFYIRSWRLRGLRDATPRLNLEGPLISHKLYFSEGLEYEVRKTEVYTLPWQQQKKKEGVNSFAQVDWVSSESNLLTATVHVAPQRLDNVNLDYFNPAPATPQAGTQNYTATIADHLTIFGGILEATLSATRFDASVWGNGQADLVVTPEGNSGSYFAQQNRVASRISGRPAYSLRPVQLWGTHNFKIGSYLAYSADHGQMNEHTIDILDGQNRLEEQIAFIGGRAYSMDDREYAFFGQDHWTLSSRVAIDLGVRTESQEVSESFRVAPRGGIAWSPFAHLGTVLRLGFGLYYDHVPLNVYSFNHYPREQQTFYGPDGDIVAGPYFFGNALSQVNVKIPFVFKTQGPGNFSPRSTIGSIEVEQPLTAVLKLRVSYIETRERRTGDSGPPGARPDQQHRRFRADGRGGIALPPVRGHGAAAAGREAPVVLFLRAKPVERGPERLQQLPGQLSGADHPPQPIRHSARRSAQPFRGLGTDATAARLAHRAGGGIPLGLSLLGAGCGTELRGSGEFASLSRFLGPRCAGFQGHPGEEIHAAFVAERLQPDQPLQPGSGALQHRRPGLWPFFRRAAPAVHHGLRRVVLRRAEGAERPRRKMAKSWQGGWWNSISRTSRWSAWLAR